MYVNCVIIVQSQNQVRITDFGLAALLNYSEENFTSSGGKVQYFSLVLLSG